MRDTQCVEDKVDLIKGVTNFIQQASLYTGRFEQKSNFGKQFHLIETTAKGDCFYDAISLLFFGHEYFARGLRVVTAAHMAINEAFCTKLIDFFQELDITWLAVLDIEKWAESVEIVFLSNVLCRTIKVYEIGSRGWYQYPLLNCESPKEALHLHLGHRHYSALRMKRKFPPIEADVFQLPNLPPLTIL